LTDKWKFLVEHGLASFIGLPRMFFSRPRFALTLLACRARYFFTRRLKGPVETPEQFLIDTPDTLIAYWSMFVERELSDPLWVDRLRTLEKCLVVDVGANAGVFSHFVHCLNPAVEIVSFEPLPGMVERIRAMAERTGVNLVCHQKAVSAKAGEAFFESPHGYEGTSRLSQEGVSGKNVFRVMTTTLDEVLGERKIDLIKIDVEGFECDVLKGASKTVQQTDFLIIEAQTSPHLLEIEHILGPDWRRKKLGSSDFLFYH
jgi:FkbM family methyltransferase